MAKKRTKQLKNAKIEKRGAQQTTDLTNETLVRLHLLYGKRSMKSDMFGRRVALPSEIAALLKNRTAPSHSPDKID